MVERKPSKLGVAGSSPVSRSILLMAGSVLAAGIGEVSHSLSAIDCDAQVAQSVEHVLGKDEVGGSIPLLGFALSFLEMSAPVFDFWLFWIDREIIGG